MAEIITDPWLLHPCASGQCRRPISRSSVYCCAACEQAWTAPVRYDVDGYHGVTCEERHAVRVAAGVPAHG